MRLVEKLRILSLLCYLAASGTSTPLALQLLKALTDPSSTVAVICSRKDAGIVSELAPSFPISLTVWSCLGKTHCLQNISRYLTQNNTDFPRPGVAFVPYAGGRSLQALRAIVAKFEKYHSNIQWIFASRNHEDVLGTFSGHLCNVISVVDENINAPSDGYMLCEERHVFLKAEEVLKAERVPPRGTYSRNERIRFAIQDEGDKFCFLKKFELVELARHAYTSLNNTFIEGCNHGDSVSLLLDKRVDLVLTLSKSVQPTSYYAYAVRAPDAVCFFTSRARPQQPSFTSCWFVFFTLSFVLAPIAALCFFLLNFRARLRLGETPRTGPFILFFVSLYLGRSPSSPTRASCSTVRIMIAAWAMGMFILGQYTQTTITASRSVPAYSSQIKRLSELASRLEDGTIKLCIHSVMTRLVHTFGGYTPELERVRKELRNCKYKCLHDDAKRTCIRLVQTGTYAMLHRRQFFLHDTGLSMGMAMGEEVLFSYFSWSPTHRKFPLRHQHRRLLQALQESGLHIKVMRREIPPPTIREDFTSFNISFTEYAVVYVVGCCLSLLVFAAELLWHLCHGSRRPLRTSTEVLELALETPEVIPPYLRGNHRAGGVVAFGRRHPAP